MKKLFLILIGTLLIGILSAQNAWIYPLRVGSQGKTTGLITLYGITSGSALLRVSATAGTGTIFQLPSTNGNNGEVLTTNGSGVLSWASVAGVEGLAASDTAAMLTPYVNHNDTISMLSKYARKLSPTFTGTVVLPATTSVPSGGVLQFNTTDVTLTHASNLLTLAGGNLALGTNSLTMTGSIAATGNRVTKGWFTDVESTNLPTVNGGTLKTALSFTATDVGLGNVTNESKATMFTNSALTGVPTAPTAANGTNTTQIATTAFVLANAGEGAVFDTTFMSTRIDSIVTVLSDTIVGNTVFAAKFLIDTTLITSTTYTMQATDAGKELRFSHATYQEVTIPANTMPVGSVVTLVKYGAGPIRVNGGANVYRDSVLDSCTMNTVKETYQIIFRTTNKPRFVGNWRD